MSPIVVDALVVGAGFGGIYQLYSLLKLGLVTKAIEKAEGAGGVWFWNKYPGVMSDTESYLYRYSWDKEDLQTYPWPNNYLTRDEILKYLNHIIDKHRLREHLHFSSELLSAKWDESINKWHVQTSTGDTFIATYLFTALGIHNKLNIPDFPGLDLFRGPVMHSASWNSNVDITNKRVGVIGCGSSGIQISNAIAPKVTELHCFIRHPQFSVPLRLQPISAGERSGINHRYDDIWAAQALTREGHGYDEPETSAMSVAPEERQRVFERLWKVGNGFRFLHEGFGDLTSNPEANEEACKFLRSKIISIVKDPAKAAVLTPRDLFARRPPCDQGYYEKFNHANVFAIDLQTTPILKIEGKGIRTSDGKLHELDVIVLATGFHSGDGSYKSIPGHITGRGGISLSEHWRAEIRTYLGMFVSSFPNLFMVNGPQGSFSHAPRTIESEVDFLTTMISELQKTGSVGTVECTADAEAEWVLTCDDLAASRTLVNNVSSWLTGLNVDGAKPSTLFYYAGLKEYRRVLENVKDKGYHGLSVSTAECVPRRDLTQRSFLFSVWS
ncbi:Baeyer-Villiger monooxygenase [Lachnellula suecica]|uniref:Baeyer-Villiger monooxygenase n=1 Tax=Lachnellula suecica TaxID=602035 RepID=A0A8T9C217_9HELO|nr:Baeyer-Villiger monooxygenase [Lachnellula suecica]